MRKSLKFMALAVLAAALSACGGGGGSAGTVSAEYQITLRADKTQLPVNISHADPGIGSYAPYTTTLYVQATVNGAPIPGGDKIFECNLSAGLSTGSLYYLDGDPAHQKQVSDGNGGQITVDSAYRSVTLGSNSGGNSFHFHAGDQAGTAGITCSVQDPRDKQLKSASVTVTVGGSTGKVASVQTVAQVPGYLGVQGNVKGINPSVAIQATVRDDANQLIVNPSANNLQIAIRQNLGGAAVGARLVSGSASGGSIQVSTNNGVGTFNLISGAQAGPIVLELTADRADNNVANGIQDPMVTLYQVYAVQETGAFPVITTTDLGNVPNGVPFTYGLVATGGVPPFTWTVSGLPAGLTANSSGVISGTPLAPAGTYPLRIGMTDANGKVATPVNVSLTITGQPLTANDINYCTNGAGLTPGNPCDLPPADRAVPYVFAFSTSVSGVTWDFQGLPGWLTGSNTGNSGVVSGMVPACPPAPAICTSVPDATFLVTVTSGAMNVTRYVRIKVNN